MFELIIILIIYFVLKNNFTNISTKLNNFLESQHFSNISKNLSIPGITLVSANSNGENHLFAFKNTQSLFSITEINTVYECAQKEHIHNVILITPFLSYSPDVLKKVTDYNMQIWDYKKLSSITYSKNTTSILKTSNTSDDTCKIDNNGYDPIQQPSSFLKNIFKKPDRL